MKVGILTFHNTTNYGATLQAYALWQTIKKQGHDVEFIDYQPYQLVKGYSKILYQNKYFVTNFTKSQKMKRFLRTQMQLGQRRFSTELELKKYNHPYDVVVCGSDEIWNIDSPFTGFERNYFLNFVSSQHTRKVSYAASFGSTINLGSYKEEIAALLKDFYAVSVRDTNSLKLVTDECNVNAVKVLDPTFLGDYIKVTSTPKTKKRYILVYGGLSLVERNYVKAVAQAEKLDIISVGHPFKTAQANWLGAGVEEWLGCYSQATYVFTSFFHGTIFSLLFQKPFYVFGRADKSIKVQDLLNMLELEDRILEKESLLGLEPKLNWEIDFNSIRVKLENLIQESRTFLTKALSI